MNMFKDPWGFLRHHGARLTPDLLTKSFGASLRAATSATDKVADFFTRLFGTVGFLALNALLFAVWVFLNLGFLGYEPFDPFPFGLLTMIVSLEAIFLSIIVLITQNRQAKIADLRQKMDFEIDVRAENEITKILQLLNELHQNAGLGKDDAELQEMIQKTDIGRIEEEVRNRDS